MSVVALFTWISTIFVGLLLLVIWLLEYDREYQSSAATRLPVPVISAHALLGMGGLVLWIYYLVADQERVAWATLGILGTGAVLGLIMAARWLHVYRAFTNPGPKLTRTVTVPPERNFPVPVVITHGILAFTTIGLVVFSVFGQSLGEPRAIAGAFGTMTVGGGADGGRDQPVRRRHRPRGARR